MDGEAGEASIGGGKLIVEKQVVPGMGTFSLFADPEGRVLGMWKPA